MIKSTITKCMCFLLSFTMVLSCGSAKQVSSRPVESADPKTPMENIVEHTKISVNTLYVKAINEIILILRNKPINYTEFAQNVTLGLFNPFVSKDPYEPIEYGRYDTIPLLKDVRISFSKSETKKMWNKAKLFVDPYKEKSPLLPHFSQTDLDTLDLKFVSKEKSIIQAGFATTDEDSYYYHYVTTTTPVVFVTVEVLRKNLNPKEVFPSKSEAIEFELR